MVLQILADAMQISDGSDPEFFQLGRVPHA